MDRRLQSSKNIPHRRFRKLKPPARCDAEAVDLEILLRLYRWMTLARAIDQVEADLVTRSEAFFHLPSTGHEGNAALAPSLLPQDWLHLHYRSKALLVARGVPLEDFFHNLLCTRDSQSAGRQMSPFMSDPGRRILSQNIPVGNHALQAVGVAAELKRAGGAPGHGPIVVCSLGDGGSQQGEVLEAIAEAVRVKLPVLFFIEDNGYAISTRTEGNTFYSLPARYDRPESLFGLPLHRLDGRDPAGCLQPLARIVGWVRESRAPGIVIFEVERLGNHTNADDERVYRSAAERDQARQCGDPLNRIVQFLCLRGVSEQDLEKIASESRREVEAGAERALGAEDPEAVLTSKAEYQFVTREALGNGEGPRLTMLEAIREVLRQRLESDSRVTLLGQDIEDPKGDVFGVTRGLSTAFPGRVVNSALSESLIVGTSIGRALAGGRPVAFIQFADFLPQAFNQIYSELGSIFWRSAGGWNCPAILMVACGGYRPGLGPFHSQTLESVLAHVPGIDVVMPSTAADAAGLLQAAFDSPRPTVFLYPKVCLNDRDRAASIEIAPHRVGIGQARTLRPGDDLTLVAWGSTVPVCERAVDALAQAALGLGIDLIDLRSISPWDRMAVRDSVRRTGKLVIVHEDNRTCGFGAEVIADVIEAVDGPIQVRRVARPDTYVPCHFASQLETLPSLQGILAAIAELLDLDVRWETAPKAPSMGETLIVKALGASPADQTIRVVEWKVAPGDHVKPGQFLAELEADKALYPLSAQASGTVRSLMVAEGLPVRPGTPILELHLDEPALQRRQRSGEESRLQRITRKAEGFRRRYSRAVEGLGQLSHIAVAQGSRIVTNDNLAAAFPGKTPDDIFTRTGIASRRWMADDESVLGMAIAAARSALEADELSVSDLDGLICCTTTPPAVTPSLACTILAALCQGTSRREVPAFDLFAACTGYLYALTCAFDMIRTQPTARILIVTAEGMSRATDPDDFDTVILFGDAATATIVCGPDAKCRPFARFHRPIVSAKGEPGRIVRVPLPGTGYFGMEGLHLYVEAVRSMTAMLQKACEAEGVAVGDLSLIVPHQANGRIMSNLGMLLGLPSDRIASNIAWTGNTSSSSIPLCLADYRRRGPLPPGKIGLTAFGGGLTFGAALLEVPR